MDFSSAEIVPAPVKIAETSCSSSHCTVLTEPTSMTLGKSAKAIPIYIPVSGPGQSPQMVREEGISETQNPNPCITTPS